MKENKRLWTPSRLAVDVVGRIYDLQKGPEWDANVANLKEHFQDGGCAIFYFNHFSLDDSSMLLSLLSKEFSGLDVNGDHQPAISRFCGLIAQKHHDLLRRPDRALLARSVYKAFDVELWPVVQSQDETYSSGTSIKKLRELLRKQSEVLATPSSVIGLAPSGERKKGGKLGSFFPGIGSMVRTAGRDPNLGDAVKVVPIVLIPETIEVSLKLNLGKSFAGNIGTPVPATSYKDHRPKEITSMLWRKMAAMLPNWMQ